MALGGIGAVIILLVWGIIATLPKKEDGREEEVRLRSEIKDNFTLKDMLGSVEKEMENRRETPMPGGGNYGMDEPEDTVSPESEIQRIRELIRRNEQTLGSGPLSGTEQPAPSAFREKEATEGVAKKPSAKQVKEAVEKLDSEIREINREYFQATYEAQYSDNAAERESEVSAAGKNREKKLVKAYEKFNSAAVPERKECNVGKIVKELRKERVAVENMKAGEWHSLMKGKAVQPPLVSGASGAAGKGSALMLARTPAGYALKAAGTINQASRQANAEM